MSNVTFDIQWEESTVQLVELLTLEVPKFSFPGPQNLTDYCRIYIKYLQVYRMLEDCYHQIIHPQKRMDCKKALDAVAGRVLEIKSWMVFLNAGKEIINFEDTLLSMNMTPDTMDVIPPRLLSDDNARNLETRERFLLKVIDKGEGEKESLENSVLSVYTEEEAVAILQRNEKGRQARAKLVQLTNLRFTQEEALRKQQAGHEPLTQETAAIVMQAAARGFLARCRVKHSTFQELTLLDMNPFIRDSSRDAAFGRVNENIDRRKKRQLLNYQEYLDAMFSAREQVKELESQEMREIIQEKINKWLNENRDPDTGFFPGFPKASEGGSRFMVFPPPKLEFEPEKQKKKDAKGGADAKKKKKAKPSLVPPPVQIPEGDGEEKPPTCPAFFLRHVRESVELYTRTWHDKDDSISNLVQKHDTDMLKSQLRPSIFEEVRVEVDETTRKILENIKKRILAEIKAARKKQKGDKKKPPKKEKKKDKDDAPPPPKKKGKKKGKDPTAQRTIESLYSELAKNDIIQLCPKRQFDDYVATDWFSGTNFELEQPGLDPSSAQVKRLIIEYCVMPLISDFVHEHAPYIKSVMLYGGEGNGKSLLVHAACRAAGATYFNLSPHVTDKKYPGKQGAKMLQMVFKVARIMAPSIVHVAGVEKVFVTDKKKIKAYGFKDKPNRLKKALMKEVNGIKPGERVLFIGTSSRPQDAPGKSPAFMKFFSKRIYVPYPDYGNRVRLWRALMERHGGVVTEHFNLSTIAQLSDGFSISSIEHLCKIVLTEKRKRKLRRFPMTIKEVIGDLHNMKPVEPAFHQQLREWGKPKKPSSAAKGKGKGKGKDKKGKKK